MHIQKEVAMTRQTIWFRHYRYLKIPVGYIDYRTRGSGHTELNLRLTVGNKSVKGLSYLKAIYNFVLFIVKYHFDVKNIKNSKLRRRTK